MFIAKEEARGRMMQLLCGRCPNASADEGMRQQRRSSSKEPYHRDTVKVSVTATDAENQGDRKESISSALIFADRGSPE